jgi:hypothetical protein
MRQFAVDHNQAVGEDHHIFQSRRRADNATESWITKKVIALCSLRRINAYNNALINVFEVRTQ